MKIFGHRGASHWAPENSKSSILKAWELGAHGVEFDVQLTKDDQIILLHDDSLERTGNFIDPSKNSHQELKKFLSEPIRNLKWSEISQSEIEIGSYFDQNFSQEPLITFSSALKLLPPQKEFLVEIKGGDYQIIKPLEKLILKNQFKKFQQQVKFIGFDVPLMVELKKVFPQIECYAIFENPPQLDQLELVFKGNLNGIDLKADQKGINKEVMLEINEFQNKNLKKKRWNLITWVISSPLVDGIENAKRLRELGVDILTSNLPPDILKFLNSNGKS
jgi:glycerophosphoryl diester phosphodiesterase